MRIRSVNSLQVNDRLAKAIYNENGQALLNSGVLLTKTIIDRIKRKGISFVYIEDNETKDIYVDDVIPEHEKLKSVMEIENNFGKMSRDITLGKSIDMDKISPTFGAIVKNILHGIKDQKEVISMLSDVYCYDSYVFQHSLNVTIYSLALGNKLGLNDKQLNELGMGAILHDIGKVAIPVEILNKQDKLTDEEFQLIQEHSTIGFDLLRKSQTISLIAAHCAYQHHERLDGSGYPRGIKGKDIHLYAKIIGIADVFDAVTGNRVYRKAKLPHEALDILYAGVNTLYEKEMVEVFSRTVALYPVGLEVVLSNGHVGVVARQNGEFTTRPVVRVIEENNIPVKPYDLDLMKQLDITIVECEVALTQKMVGS
ncbi:HD-GYP domain-containing protein [Evansella cellulosilytica]|uniref:Metal dependent phosphohydrolase n=1 Tax=Evansella cellulosilytica (strain ATCC 21833 / DSM 2522 / FERM P-1141 / JCM 9156 / N-4) TaxID=649639 RepID=E6U2F6_EVAC2|nr:HD-GYP domain-containing protein [Evansella cellulosilytica]ADU31669.1 metal dependent phosphohydrolase [Evansella cellulosilytica DSM 2522]